MAGETQDGGYSEGRTGPCLVWGGSSPAMRVSPALRGRSCPAPCGGGQRPRRHLLSPRPPHHGCSPPCRTEARFAAPTLGLAVSPRQTLGGKEDFSSQKSHLKGSPVVAAPRQPLSVVALPLAGALPRRNPTARDLAAPVGMAARSAVPSSGPSTPETHHCCERRSVLQRDVAVECVRPRGGSALPPRRAKHPGAEPEPQRNLFLALPYLPSVLPFF